jgi:hypothetical protein
MLKALAVAIPLSIGTAFYAGAIPSWFVGAEIYRKQIEKPVPTVVNALENIEFDLLSEAGNNGVELALPQIRRRKNPDGYSWFVMSGRHVAAEMVVTLAPVAKGAATDVRGHVEMGTAPGTAPGIGNERIMQFLFANALDAALAPLARPAERLGAEETAKKKQLGDAAMTTAAILADPMAISSEAIERYEEHEKVEREAEERERVEEQRRASGVSFEPGKPMVDLSKR